MPERPIAVLAFSGGLDTSYCVSSLTHDGGYDVHTVLVDTGGFTRAELDAIEARARALGSVRHVVIDATEHLYRDCLRFLVYGNVLRGGVYPLSVSAERVTQATEVARYARSVSAACVAHGSTGAGNDQVRFDGVLRTVAPELQVVTPIRDRRLSREDEIAYLRDRGVVMDWRKARYSVNQGLWGATIGGVETLRSDGWPPEDAFPTPVTAGGSREVVLEFRRGEYVGLDGGTGAGSVASIRELHGIAAPYGIGRDVHVGDTIIGIKGRVAFEAPAPLIIIRAHHTLEKHVLTRMQQNVKDQVAAQYGAMLHEGQFLDPAARDIEALLERSQQQVTGRVRVLLAPYRFHVLGVESPHDLMSTAFGAYGEMNTAWSGDDVRGYARILANQAMMHRAVNGGGDEAGATGGAPRD